ncbi:MAG: hypothetical protein CO105_10840 [Comamonadaceae bacterium CG_4_9_14_3_um_filter_60_33]|nr:MAG: hypothetical protein CO105_10840 [Comamonadaceae bacterium CG_4_9_14_3_um_filter_60_33]
MTVSVEQIASFLDQIEFKYERQDNLIRSGMKLAGDHSVNMIFNAPKEGRIFELTVGRIIPMELVQASAHTAAFHLYLLSAAWDTSFGTPEVDKGDGEVRVLVEVPLADAVMTLDQVRFCIRGAVQLCEKIREEGTEVLKTGQLPTSATNIDAATMARLQIIQLMETAKGRATARAMATNTALPQAVRDVAQKMLPVMDAMDQAEAAPTSI